VPCTSPRETPETSCAEGPLSTLNVRFPALHFQPATNPSPLTKDPEAGIKADCAWSTGEESSTSAKQCGQSPRHESLSLAGEMSALVCPAGRPSPRRKRIPCSVPPPRQPKHRLGALGRKDEARGGLLLHPPPGMPDVPRPL